MASRIDATEIDRPLDEAQRVLDDLQMLLAGLRQRDPDGFRRLHGGLACYGQPSGDKVWPAMDLSWRYLRQHIDAAQAAWFRVPERERWRAVERTERSAVEELQREIAELRGALKGAEMRLDIARKVEAVA